MENMYYCPQCGAPVAYGAHFCSNCGTTLDWTGQPIPPPPPPQSYDYQYPDEQGAWDQEQPPYGQQPGWDQPPPYDQPQDWGYPGQYGQQDMRGRGGGGARKPGSSTPIIILIALIVIIGAVAGVGFVTDWTFSFGSDQDTSPPSETAPEVVSFSLSSPMITQGQTSTLRWDVDGATSVSIDRGIGDVFSSGTQVVNPTTSTTYTLTATNEYGSVDRSVTLTVTPLDLPEITSFTADPAAIESGESSTLEWEVDGSTSVSINQNIGGVPSSGTEVVSPDETTTYTLTATNEYGSVDESITVTVNPGDAPVITSFTASPGTIVSGGSSTLSWDVEGATSVSIDNDVGSVNPSSGTEVVSPDETTEYILTATSSGGSVTESVTVTVTATDLPEIVSFEASSTSIDIGESPSPTLSWEVAGATSVSIDQYIWEVLAEGTKVVTPSVTTTYTITATNGYGSVDDSVTISVASTDLPEITSFTSNPHSIITGETSTLQWEVSDADEIVIDNEIGIVGPTGTEVVSPDVGITVYNITAYNDEGFVTAYVKVEVSQFMNP
jgi:hypothetical protein